MVDWALEGPGCSALLRGPDHTFLGCHSVQGPVRIQNSKLVLSSACHVRLKALSLQEYRVHFREIRVAQRLSAGVLRANTGRPPVSDPGISSACPTRPPPSMKAKFSRDGQMAKTVISMGESQSLAAHLT